MLSETYKRSRYYKYNHIIKIWTNLNDDIFRNENEPYIEPLLNFHDFCEEN